MMKKQRQGILLTVLCDSSAVPAMEDLIFRETTTFGIRSYLCSRAKLDRRHIEVDTVCCKIRIKIGSRRGQDITFAPEYEDCAAAAKLSEFPLKEVYRLALQAMPLFAAGEKC